MCMKNDYKLIMLISKATQGNSEIFGGRGWVPEEFVELASDKKVFGYQQ